MRYILCCAIILCLICHTGLASIKARAEVDLNENKISVYKGFLCVATYDCATGSKEKKILNGKEYKFETPKGYFRIYRKTEHPLWTPPDWYYEEMNLPVVPLEERKPQEGILGDYALYMPNEIMIHGTMDESTIGKAVTHGCIRMRKEDLKKVYRILEVGSEVFIY